MKPQPLPWCDPLALAQACAGPMVLLHSSVRASYSGQLTLLATGIIESADITRFDELSQLEMQEGWRWFGYLSYAMRHDAERYSQAAQPGYDLPPALFMRFANIYIFDHDRQALTLWAQDPTPQRALRPLPDYVPPHVSALSSNMTRAEYEHKAAHIIEDIKNGALYQANLTRKFYGTWDAPTDGLLLFARMCAITPAPYSAYLRFGDKEILSSSPELFLRLDTQGLVETRPIKGSAPRSADAAQDIKQRSALEASDKNRAENLMIIDLMRHDLARACAPGSIEVSGLFEVTTHATIHHMASTVRGRLSQGIDVAQLLKASFPPGSMTGAPKIRAVELCTRLEGVERGIYSGAIGWLAADGSAEFSVVIRTLVIQGRHFEFQVGGGIVADSTPAGEWQETMDKALGILKTLGIERSVLEKL